MFNFRELVSRLYRRNLCAAKSVSLTEKDNKFVPLDFQANKKLRDAEKQSLELLIERYLIEEVEESQRSQLLSVWWRRYYKLIDSNAELFPANKVNETDKLKNLIKVEFGNRL